MSKKHNVKQSRFGMGRPKVSEELRRNKLVAAMYNTAEKNKLKDTASKLGMSAGGFQRMCVAVFLETNKLG